MRHAALLAVLMLSGSVRAAAEEAPPAPPPDRLAIGADIGGGHVRWRFAGPWAAELRYVSGNADSTAGRVSAGVMSARGLRYFGAAKRTRFFAGVEAGYVSSSASGSAYKVAGPLAGAVAGVEFRVLRRLAVGLDAGPYLFALHEKSTAASQTSADFVFNSSLSFFLF